MSLTGDAPKMYPPPSGKALKYAEIVKEGKLHCKSPRNTRFDQEERTPELSAEAGLWRYKEFLELYEPVEESSS